MSREIKFRFYSNHLKKFVVPNDKIFVGALKDPDMNPMQYTGLKGKNGVEIYEDDFVTKQNGKPMRIQFRQLEAPDGGIIMGFDFPSAYTTDLEVIGNIYENPELVEADNE